MSHTEELEPPLSILRKVCAFQSLADSFVLILGQAEAPGHGLFRPGPPGFAGVRPE
jgi:hypothetical protein